jgi:hypothetical protein
MQVLPGGFGGSTGDTLTVATTPVHMSGNVWYVNSTTGTDAGSPAGRERNKPLATIAQAITNASNDDVIIFLSTHAETITSNQIIAKRLVFVGEGTASGVPTVTFTRNFNGTMFSISAGGAGSQFRNIKFPASSQASASARISTSAAVKMIGCYVESGANDTGAALSIGAEDNVIESTTFISSSVTTAPSAAVAYGGGFTRLSFKNVIFDGGTVGFSLGIALDNASNTVNLLVMEGITLRNGADISVGSSSTGFVAGLSSTNGGRVIW